MNKKYIIVLGMLLAIGSQPSHAAWWPFSSKKDFSKFPSLKPWPDTAEKVIKIDAEPITRNFYNKPALEYPIFDDVPLNFLAFDTNKGRVVVHLTAERDKELGNIWPGKSMSLTCDPIAIRTMRDGSTQTHCKLKEIFFCGCSGK